MDNVCLCEAPRIKAKFRRTWECTICGKPEQPNTAEAAHPAPATVEIVKVLEDAGRSHPQYCETMFRAAEILAALAPATEGRKG